MKAVVTGAGSFLGKKICSFLKAKGYQVICTAHKNPLLNVYRTISTDLTSIVDVEKFCDEIVKENEIDLIVNNFGPFLKKPLLETDVQEVLNQFQSVCFTPYILMQRLYPLLEKNKGGIINIGLCGLNHTKSNSHFPIYKSAKHTLYYLTKCFAKELMEKNIRVNMISPGYLEKTLDLPSSIDTLPQKRLIEFDEVIATLKFLIDPKNRSITGQNIEVAGGIGL